MTDLKAFLDRLVNSHPFADLLRRAETSGCHVKIDGVAGSLGAFAAAALLQHFDCMVMLVAASPAAAEAALDDLNALLGSDRVGFMPPSRLHPLDASPLAIGPRSERTDALMRLISGAASAIVTQPETLIEPDMSRDLLDIRSAIRRIESGKPGHRDQLLRDLAGAGFTRESMVAAAGQFAVRGGLLDIFAYGHENPVRIEFEGDVAVSIRQFDPESQRSVGRSDAITIYLGSAAGWSAVGLIPDDAIILWLDFDAITARVDRFRESAWESISQDRPPGIETAQSRTERLRNIVWRGPLSQDKHALHFKARRPDPSAGGFDEIASQLRRCFAAGIDVWVTADSDAERGRFEELTADLNLQDLRIITPSFSGGFVSPVLGSALLTTHELFNRRRMRARHTRFRRRAAAFDRSALRRGDIVVHAEYGIGEYEGLQTVKVRGQPRECLRIRYAENTILYIRIEQFTQVEKFVGSGDAKPSLSRIGSSDWARTKKRTRKALKDMAGELIRLYAKRKVARGVAFPEDSHWQAEMEGSFEFEDTPDQSKATTEVKADMQAPHPMDRLLCGDVGFGKTEVAVRAAFKAVQDSHQVAVLVPTTILAAQHHETFRERLASYPVRIETLSRFRTPVEQRQVVKAAKEGLVDIVIGTHRLLSRDLEFKKLGLLIIDEEHRFGVRHKERLKQMKTNVDVLTLTATPIPRTLHLALMGARDTSQINTPPVDRLPIQTEIHDWSEELIRDAILSEIDRQGQVFFLHNRVQSIGAVRGMLERIAPGLRYAVAHGQMPERELERVMLQFTRGGFDVLITTMIIESGLDIPNVNTLIVNRADRFGLAQLYQLRGRIGRSNRQAYAYLLTPPRMAMTLEAQRRLATLAELTDLGSGLKIALRDLELRGAGNLLGPQQSGFINAVGFDLYTRMLEEEVGSIKGTEVEAVPDGDEVKVEFDGAALLPMNYIDESDIRYDFYRRLAEAREVAVVDALEDELRDRFGNLVVPARNLFDLTRLKLLGRDAGFARINLSRQLLTATLNLPESSTEAQSYLGRLVAGADPLPVEFRMSSPVELIYRLNSGEPVEQAKKFLQHLARMGILQG